MKRTLPPLSAEAARARDDAPTAGMQRSIGARDAVYAWRATVDKESVETSSNAERRKKARLRASGQGGTEPDPRSARPEVVLRISVIDGNDRLVYADTRNRRGWTEPLAAGQVASELLKRSVATDRASSSEPRIVRTLEAGRAVVAPHGRTATVPHALTPYSVGRASALAGPSVAVANQRGQQSTMAPASTKPSSQARAR